MRRAFCGPTTFQELAVFLKEFINRDHPTFSIIIKVLYHINMNLVDHISKEKKDCTAKSVQFLKCHKKMITLIPINQLCKPKGGGGGNTTPFMGIYSQLLIV